MSMIRGAMRRQSALPALAFAAIAVLSQTGQSLTANGSIGMQDAQLVSATDAKVLLYVSPIAEEVRVEGWDVALELQTSPELNQSDYYYFWAYNSEHKSNGSVTVGYFAINKHTAEVWDIDKHKRLSSKLLQGVQKLIRHDRHITDETVSQYAVSRPWK
jgi:hypothetical protein